MTDTRPVAEPLFWVSLLIGMIGFPLLVWARGQTLDGHQAALGSLFLLGAASFGFGATLLLAAHGRDRLHPPLVIAAALGALGGGLFLVLLAAELAGGLRLFAFSILVVDAAGVASARRAWRASRGSDRQAPAEPA